MAGQGVYVALRYLDTLGVFKDSVTKGVVDALKVELQSRYIGAYTRIFNSGPYENLDDRPTKLGLAMQELRKEIEERTVNLNTAASQSKRGAIAEVGQSALIAGGKSALTNIGMELALGTATSGVSLGTKVLQSMAPELLKMAGMAFSSKSAMVNYYLEKGANSSALLSAVALTLMNQYYSDIGDVTFSKPTSISFITKQTSVRMEKQNLEFALVRYMDLVESILRGETSNSEHVSLLSGMSD
jgi:hypothetical protein